MYRCKSVKPELSDLDWTLQIAPTAAYPLRLFVGRVAAGCIVKGADATHLLSAMKYRSASLFEITRKTALQDPDGPTAGDVGISVVVVRREIEDPGGREHLPR